MASHFHPSGRGVPGARDLPKVEEWVRPTSPGQSFAHPSFVGFLELRMASHPRGCGPATSGVSKSLQRGATPRRPATNILCRCHGVAALHACLSSRRHGGSTRWHRHTALSSNGRIPDSESGDDGSSPSGAATLSQLRCHRLHAWLKPRRTRFNSGGLHHEIQRGSSDNLAVRRSRKPEVAVRFRVGPPFDSARLRRAPLLAGHPSTRARF